MRRRIRRKSPEAASRPATTTSTRSASRSTSSRMWLEKRIVRPVGRHGTQQVHHLQPLARVHAVERLVEEQDRRVVDQRGGDLDPLPHALRVAADRPVRRVASSTRSMRASPPRPASAISCRRAERAHELPAGEEGVHRLALGDEADAPVDLRVPPGRRPVDRTSPDDGAGSRPSCAGSSTCRRRSARAGRSCPPPSAKVTSLTATTLPYQRETFAERRACSRRHPPMRMARVGPARCHQQDCGGDARR